MYNVPVAIQCVPERRDGINKSVSELNAMGFSNVMTFYDHDMNGPLWNFKQILNADYAKDTHVLVLQDDIIFARNFAQHIQCLLLLKHHCISLFAPPRKAYSELAKNGVRLHIEKDFLWMPAILMSTEFMRGLLSYGYTKDMLLKMANKHDDVMVGEYAKATKKHVLITIPSIVQHDLNIKSSIGTPSKIGNTKRESPLFYEVPKDYFLQ